MADRHAFFAVKQYNVAGEVAGGGDGFDQLEITIGGCFKKSNGVVSAIGYEKEFSVFCDFDGSGGVAESGFLFKS